MSATYGVDAEAVSARANGMAFSSTTRPSEAQVDRWIAQHSGRVDTVIRARGLTPATVHDATTSEVYLAAQCYVESAVAAAAMRARDRVDSELARAYASDAEAQLKTLMTWAPAFGDLRPAAPTSGIMHASGAPDGRPARPTGDAAFLGSSDGRL